MSITLILIVVAIVIMVLIWKSAMKAREIAISVAIRTCQQWSALLLDDTVCLTKLKLSRRKDSGSMCFFREYAFEYSYDGLGRYKAFLQFNGYQFLQVISNDQAITPKELQTPLQQSQQESNGNNVIDLQSFRKDKE